MCFWWFFWFCAHVAWLCIWVWRACVFINPCSLWETCLIASKFEYLTTGKTMTHTKIWISLYAHVFWRNFEWFLGVLRSKIFGRTSWTWSVDFANEKSKHSFWIGLHHHSTVIQIRNHLGNPLIPSLRCLPVYAGTNCESECQAARAGARLVRVVSWQSESTQFRQHPSSIKTKNYRSSSGKGIGIWRSTNRICQLLAGATTAPLCFTSYFSTF